VEEMNDEALHYAMIGGGGAPRGEATNKRSSSTSRQQQLLAGCTGYKQLLLLLVACLLPRGSSSTAAGRRRNSVAGPAGDGGRGRGSQVSSRLANATRAECWAVGWERALWPRSRQLKAGSRMRQGAQRWRPMRIRPIPPPSALTAT